MSKKESKRAVFRTTVNKRLAKALGIDIAFESERVYFSKLNSKLANC